MSREIKFRAWFKGETVVGNPYDEDGHNPERVEYTETMLYFDFKNIEFGRVMTGCGEYPGSDMWGDLEEMEVMLYTGLNDANGVEIYEGDIIQGLNNRKHGGDGTYPTGYSAVTFGRGGFRAFDNSLWEAMNDTCTPDSVRVVGNIYENPELV